MEPVGCPQMPDVLASNAWCIADGAVNFLVFLMASILG